MPRKTSIGRKRFDTDVRGTTSIEYALIASLIFVVIVGAVTSVGDQLALIFDSIATEFKEAPKP